MSYASESKFSEALCDAFTKRGAFHQRFESAITGRGIPDMLLAGPVRDLWVELKNLPSLVMDEHVFDVEVPWRRGQQAWAFNYRRASGRHTLTLVALNNCIVAVPMTRRFVGNVVGPNDYTIYWSLHEVVDMLMKMINLI